MSGSRGRRDRPQLRVVISYDAGKGGDGSKRPRARRRGVAGGSGERRETRGAAASGTQATPGREVPVEYPYEREQEPERRREAPPADDLAAPPVPSSRSPAGEDPGAGALFGDVTARLYDLSGRLRETARQLESLERLLLTIESVRAEGPERLPEFLQELGLMDDDSASMVSLLGALMGEETTDGEAGDEQGEGERDEDGDEEDDDEGEDEAA